MGKAIAEKLDEKRKRRQACAIKAYVHGGGSATVEGWLSKKSAHMIATLACHQVDQGMAGGIGEIGVHHGKLFILLALTSRLKDDAFAIDVFDNQTLNLDQSGCGSKERFLHNLSRFGIDACSVVVWEKSSLEMSADEITARVNKVRLLSIDGGHTVECVLNDLKLAEEVLQPHGVVIVDDVFNATWPSVMSGFSHYLHGQPKLTPFATSQNKVYLCFSQWESYYRQFFRQRFAEEFDRSDKLFGFALDGYTAWRHIRLREVVYDHVRARFSTFLAVRLGFRS